MVIHTTGLTPSHCIRDNTVPMVYITLCMNYIHKAHNVNYAR